MSSPGPRIVSVVIPVYRSEATLERLAERLLAVFAARVEKLEVVFVDDRSPDGSWAVLQRIKAAHPERFRILRLLTNYGQHNAILCGFYHATGDVIVTMDDDLQNPPEEIPKLLEAIDRGFDLVVGAYDSKKHSKTRNLGGWLVDSSLRRIFNLPSDFELTSFRAARREVVEGARQIAHSFPYITAMLFANASTYVNVPVRHDPRGHGRSNYNLRRSVSLALNLVFGYSALPLQLIALLSAGSFGVSMLIGGWVLYQALAQDVSVPGWASIMVMISFFNCLLFFCLLVFGVYLVRLSQQVTRTKVLYRLAEIQE